MGVRVNNVCEICKWRRSGHNFEQISNIDVVFPLLVLNNEILAWYAIGNDKEEAKRVTLREKCPYLEFFGLYFPSFGLKYT